MEFVADYERSKHKDFQYLRSKNFEEMLSLAEGDDVFAQVSVGALYREGNQALSVPKDSEKALYWTSRSAENGHPMGQYNLGVIYSESGDSNLSIFWLTESAKQGYRDAQVSLAYAYEQGVGSHASPNEAAFWYQKAADQGSSVGQLRLAKFYFDGVAFNKDYVKAYCLLVLAEINQHPDAIKVRMNLSKFISEKQLIAAEEKSQKIRDKVAEYRSNAAL